MNDKVTVLLPCYNESLTIAETIRQMRQALPVARVIVFDNNSTDGSGKIAADAGAEVRSVKLQGKGNVVRRMFADVESDIYLMVDGDTTYDPQTAAALVNAISSGADMAVGVRKGANNTFPPGHRFGNRLFNIIVARLFGRGMQDVFSGYRTFSRRFAKSFPAHSRGFEIETELSVFTLEQRLPFVEIDSPYGTRPSGSFSKLSTYKDGFRILLTIVQLYKDIKPMAFFGLIALVCALLSVGLGIPIIDEWVKTGLVPREPTAILCSALGILSVVLVVAGMVLHGIAQSYRETRHLFYLSHSR
jgi:glycosyltransferase involved in cell wall biosynthesis